MKHLRQAKIIELITENEIENQGDLAAYLKDAGFTVTQATISRDIRNLRLAKVSAGDGRQRYAQLSADNKETSYDTRLNELFRQGARTIKTAENIIVIKTTPGMAQAIAACVDAINPPDLLGSVAGDDTIICVASNSTIAVSLADKFKNMTN